MKNDQALENSLFDAQADELYEIVSTLSNLYNVSFDVTACYIDGMHDNIFLNDVQQLISQSRIKLRSTAGFDSSEQYSAEHVFVDNFVYQTARTIGFFIGVNKNISFDLDCPQGFVRVSSADLLSSIMKIISAVLTTVHGQGNIVVKSRYYQDMLDGTEFADLSIQDDGFWIGPDSISNEVENTSDLNASTRPDFQSIQNFLDENRIMLLGSSSPERGTSCTLRIPIADQTNNALDDEAQSGSKRVNRRWSIQLLTVNEAL